jgi:hypothetical protein
MVFWSQIYAIKACMMENIDRATQVGTSIFSPAVRQPSRLFTAPGKFQISLGLPSIPGETGTI